MPREDRDEMEMMPEEVLNPALVEAMRLYDQDQDPENGPPRRKRQLFGHPPAAARPVGGNLRKPPGSEEGDATGTMRLTPGQIDHIWDKFTRDHGHRDAQERPSSL